MDLNYLLLKAAEEGDIDGAVDALARGAIMHSKNNYGVR